MDFQTKKFILHSEFKPTGDQPQAIEKLVQGLNNNKKEQVLLGVTGSGKTFTIANVIAKINRPSLVLSHNKTLASQLYQELKAFFPENRVEYFVSYFDYYRPEAYLPAKDVFIDKTSKNNKELEAMRQRTINALSLRRDTVVVGSVASIYGAFNPQEYRDSFLPIELNMNFDRRDFMIKLIQIGYKRNQLSLDRGDFLTRGDIFEIAPSWTEDFNIRIDFFDSDIEKIATIHPITKEIIQTFKTYTILPASAYATNPDTNKRVISLIEIELEKQLEFFEKENKLLEYQRLKERITNDIDSLSEFGYVNGIENYSRYIDNRQEGEKPYTLLDYLPEDAVIFIDESHMMIPQLNGMYNGDRSRKQTLVEYGFRLPSALDNRPLKFYEFEEYNFQKIFISATPGEYEIKKADGELITQFIRPTGLLDPIIEIHPIQNQIEKIFDELKSQKEKNDRTLILTTTKRNAEELSKYLTSKKIKTAYIHSEFNTFERNTILRKLRKGIYDVVIGINLIREGIDLPEVSLICVLDADKDGLMRNTTSLIQIVGRAARNDHGRVIFFADKISKSMQETIDDNKIKRQIQQEYNKKHNIVPKTIIKPIKEAIENEKLLEEIEDTFVENSKVSKKTKEKKMFDALRKEMKEAAQKMDFEKAAQLRDMILELGGTLE
ncbi:excinuclease ABC subunit UvrB [Mycoplasma zalophi]|uniref:UvrABC system protein B n=1 Tax=Mycoplasma zalophi TaxID=191287 RepID=A0ABS6DQV1_9MOLU|nr:excinuclease ABC subunit UvrB [Mycoplasma zalophi]MBU4691006.1 excinuclease ABC subunit UvrB [Mycoplasma zalophi]MBU4692215.1 excinuclease ABC subunit UvrB [Mycoplasma zalophi]